MICERCHKKEATVHITEVLNGNRTEKHLCQDCAAQEKGMHFQQDSVIRLPTFSAETVCLTASGEMGMNG